MKTIKQFFQLISISWKQVLIVFLAGIMILTTTACSGTNASGSYTDKSTPATDAKAERLIREAEQNVQKNPNPLKEVVSEKSLEEQAKDLDRSAKQTAKEMTKSAKKAMNEAPDKAQQGLEKVKENIEGAIDQAKEATKYSNPS